MNLGSDSPRPVITRTGNAGGNGATQTVKGIEVAVSNDSPLILDIDGRAGTAWIQDHNQPFPTVTTVGEPAITLTGSESSPVLAVSSS